MKTMAARMLATMTLLAGCGLSHGDESNSSGSNWLRCKKLSECNVSQAVACSADGYCTDQGGERIAALSKPEGGDAGAMGNDSGSDAGPIENEFDCVWGMDEALRHVGAPAPDRSNCGSFGVSYSAYGFLTMVGAQGCFDRALRTSSRGVELSVNRCIDCNVPTTYVGAPSGKLYAITHDDTAFGGPLRNIKIESCEAVALNAAQTDFECAAAKELYACSEPREPARPQPTHPRITPYKLTDPPSQPDATKARVHVFVSNQSFDMPLMNISVNLDDVQVALGDFTVDTQHTWVQFELDVPLGAHQLKVFALNYREWSGRGGASLSQGISIQAERWLVLNYWYDNETDDGKVTLTESDMPVGFD